MRHDWHKIWGVWFAKLRQRPSDVRREGNRLRDCGLWGEAAAAYERYLGRRPKDRAIWIQFGNVLKELGDFSSSDIAYAKAQACSGEIAEVLRMRGHLALRAGLPSLASDWFLQSWRADPGQGADNDLFGDICIEFAYEAFVRGDIPLPAGRIESCGGRLIIGWVNSPVVDDGEVELLQGGELLGRVRADLPRPEIYGSRLGELRSGFAFDIGSLSRYPIPNIPVDARRVTDSVALVGSPFFIAQPDAVQNWIARPAPIPGVPTARPKISFIMPVYNPEVSWLIEAISSVCAQDRGDWELICVDDGSAPEVAQVLNESRARDARIKLIQNKKTKGVSAATNIGLKEARGEIVAFIDHDDKLEPEATRRIMEAVDAGVDLVYSDEALTGLNIDLVRHVEARASFSHDYYISHPYFVHLIAMKRRLALDVGGLDEELAISADVDFVLRVLERVEKIAHLPSILYRWRTHAGSLGHKEKSRVSQATVGAIERHLRRLGRKASVRPGKVFNTYDIVWPAGNGRTLAIIPTKDRLDLLSRAVDSVISTSGDMLDILIVDHESQEEVTREYLARLPSHVKVMRQEGPFNFSSINNKAVRTHGGDYERLLFLNNDVEATSPGWADRLAGLVDRVDVGIAGGSLIYPDRRVQHVGVVLGLGGPAEHVFKFSPSRLGGGQPNPGPGCAFVVTRDVSAVTAACMMMRRSVFERVGGFDEQLKIGFNDTDLCLRVRAAGYKVLNDAGCWLIHHESATRKFTDEILHPADAEFFHSRWEREIRRGDPWYSPILSLNPSMPDQLALELEVAPRVSRVSLVGDRIV